HLMPIVDRANVLRLRTVAQAPHLRVLLNRRLLPRGALPLDCRPIKLAKVEKELIAVAAQVASIDKSSEFAFVIDRATRLSIAYSPPLLSDAIDFGPVLE